MQKKVKVPKDFIKGFSYKFNTDFNRREMLEVEYLSEKVYNKVKSLSDYPDGFDSIEDDVYEFYIRNGIKITKIDDQYLVYHTYTDPYMRVADRWFLRLILDNLPS